MTRSHRQTNWLKNFLAGCLIATSVEAADAPAPYPRDLTKADIERWMTELSNWGRWGKDDQAGTINLITPEKRKQAAGLVRDGISVSMSFDADLPTAARPAGPHQGPNHASWLHTMYSNGLTRREGYVDDSYTVSFHGGSTTHLDALAHFIHEGRLYNGFPAEGTTEWGATKNDVTAFKNGILTRGVLVDVPRLKGVPYLGDSEAIYPEDLEAWEKKAGVRIKSGDAVFVRTGRGARVAAEGPNRSGRNPGLYASCAKWLRRRDIALLGSDIGQDLKPSRVAGVYQPIHELLLHAVGTPLIDNCDLEALSIAANQRGRWEFLFVTAPLRVPGGTGSPLNPIGTF